MNCSQIIFLSRKATVRLHGYKEELEVPVAELTDSLGQQYIQEQIVEAQMEVKLDRNLFIMEVGGVA